MDTSLVLFKYFKLDLSGYAYASCILDSQNGKLQKLYLFTCGAVVAELFHKVYETNHHNQVI